MPKKKEVKAKGGGKEGGGTKTANTKGVGASSIPPPQVSFAFALCKSQRQKGEWGLENSSPLRRTRGGVSLFYTLSLPLPRIPKLPLAFAFAKTKGRRENSRGLGGGR